MPLPSPSWIVIPLVLGAIIGSFIGAATLRLPRGESIIVGRSRCDGCATTLGAFELVPILSYLVLRGRCRRCRAAIAIDQLVAEVAGAGIAIGALMIAPSLAGALALAVFGWALLALALLDARHFWLPDALTLPLIVGGLAVALVLPEPPFVDRLIGAAAGYGTLAVTRALYRRLRGREGLGGGDAKLFAAIGAWLGVEALPWVMIGAGAVGMIVVALLSLQGRWTAKLDRLPLGTLLAVATLLYVPLADRLTA